MNQKITSLAFLTLTWKNKTLQGLLDPRPWYNGQMGEILSYIEEKINHYSQIELSQSSLTIETCHTRRQKKDHDLDYNRPYEQGYGGLVWLLPKYNYKAHTDTKAEYNRIYNTIINTKMISNYNQDYAKPPTPTHQPLFTKRSLHLRHISGKNLVLLFVEFFSTSRVKYVPDFE